MDKVLITKDYSESDEYLIQYLNLLFPEGEIEIIPPQAESEDICSDLEASASA